MIKLTYLGGGEESPQLLSVSQSVLCSLQHHSRSLLFNLNILNVEMRLPEIVIGDLHHGDSGVNLGSAGDVNLVFVPVNSNPNTLLNISGSYRVSKVNNKLGKLLHIDNVPEEKCESIETFLSIDNLRTPGHL